MPSTLISSNGSRITTGVNTSSSGLRALRGGDAVFRAGPPLSSGYANNAHSIGGGSTLQRRKYSGGATLGNLEPGELEMETFK
ncbi:unnamed protein product [Protopolystoma xenopodis]|uniref:Uncharacterized protein n=1 Tax=Protopolystoma xenopodis TaxID=117903 RepID=A0A448WS49_9PLAT|nr:unnamed protein product [Protopolystoma xenopodis]